HEEPGVREAPLGERCPRRAPDEIGGLLSPEDLGLFERLPVHRRVHMVRGDPGVPYEGRIRMKSALFLQTRFDAVRHGPSLRHLCPGRARLLRRSTANAQPFHRRENFSEPGSVRLTTPAGLEIRRSAEAKGFPLNPRALEARYVACLGGYAGIARRTWPRSHAHAHRSPTR